MGPRPQCYIPSHKVIGPLVLEKKIFEGFLPYMGVAAILVMWPRPREQRSVRVAERLALPTSDHGIAGSNPAGGEILPEPKRRFIAQSLSCSSFHHLEMTEILLKGCKTLTHPSIHPREQSFVPPSHWGSIWNLALICPAVLEKKIFENGGRTTDGRTTDHGYTISSPMSLKAQVS